MHHSLTIEEAVAFAARALVASGAGKVQAHAVARAVVAAHALGKANVGFEHLPYYCEALGRGAVNGRVEPTLVRAKPGLLEVNVHSGFAHYAFDRALDELVSMVADQGTAVLTLRNTFTCGALGYFPERLARRGFAAIAATNAGPAAVAASGTSRAVFSTNPIACAFPRRQEPPLVIDQSTSACTLVDVRAARRRGESIPPDWALDREGRPTEDPEEALAGSFRSFGGYKGSNIALMVELLAAGLTGGKWSMDAPSFAQGPDCPDVGLWLMAMDVESMAGGHATQRIDGYLTRTGALGAHIPGLARRRSTTDEIRLAPELYERIRAYQSGRGQTTVSAERGNRGPSPTNTHDSDQ